MRFSAPALCMVAIAACSDEVLVPIVDAGPDANDSGVSKPDSAKADVVIPDAGDGSCTTPIDCPDIFGWVCDPRTRKCTPDECGPESGKSCSPTDVCVFQLGGTTAAACYPRCVRFSQQMPCPMGQECVVGRADGTIAYCKDRGSTKTGDFCPIDSISTGCVAGDMCSADPQTRYCLEQCDFWGSLKDCPSDLCTPPGVCTRQTTDPAAVGASCNGASAQNAPCAPSGAKLLGLCIGPKGSAWCRAWCRLTVPTDCPMNQTCLTSGVPSIGYCQ